MEEKEGLPLVHLVRDYYMNTFANYSFGDIFADEQFALFHQSMMGIMYGIVLSESDSYLANLIKAETLESLSNIISLGYSQAHG